MAKQIPFMPNSKEPKIMTVGDAITELSGYAQDKELYIYQYNEDLYRPVYENDINPIVIPGNKEYVCLNALDAVRKMKRVNEVSAQYEESGLKVDVDYTIDQLTELSNIVSELIPEIGEQYLTKPLSLAAFAELKFKCIVNLCQAIDWLKMMDKVFEQDKRGDMDNSLDIINNSDPKIIVTKDGIIGLEGNEDPNNAA